MKDLHGILEHDLTLLIGLGGYTESSFADAPAESIRGRLWRSGNIDAKTTTNDDTMLSNFMDKRDLTSTIVANPFVLSAFLDKIPRKMRCQVKWHVIQGRLDVGESFSTSLQVYLLSRTATTWQLNNFKLEVNYIFFQACLLPRTPPT